MRASGGDAGRGVALRPFRHNSDRMITLLTILTALAMLATLGVLFAGMIGMVGGQGDGTRSNRLMRWRVGLQALALGLFALLLLLTRR